MTILLTDMSGVDVSVNFDPVMIGLQAIAAIVTIFILYKFAWNPYLDYINKRNNNINENIEQASKKNQDAQQYLDEKVEEIKSFKDEKSRMLNVAKTEATNQKNEILENARKQAMILEQKSKEQIEREAKDAEKEIEKDLLELVNGISQKFISKEITSDDELNLYFQAIDKVGNNE